MWRDTGSADAATARELAARLERRARADDEVEARDAYLGLLGIADGQRVLDVGCGSGAVTRAIARRVGDRGVAVGLDPSPALLEVARELAREAGLGDRIELYEGSALRLPFPDRSFDAVLCATVLSHVPGGEAAIPELVRVLRPGGRLGVFDMDTDMTTFTHPDRALRCHGRGRLARAADAISVRASRFGRHSGARILSTRDRSAELLCRSGRAFRRGCAQGGRHHRRRAQPLGAGASRGASPRAGARRASPHLRPGPQAGLRGVGHRRALYCVRLHPSQGDRLCPTGPLPSTT
jgi:ubiquinone/menaquinone biosynthesis C-methylase UbiE